MNDVTIKVPSAATTTVALPLDDVVTVEDENLLLRADIRRLESEALTRDVAVETIGTLLACAISQLMDDCDYPVEEIVFTREHVRRMQARKPHIELRETVGGDTAAKLAFRDGVSVGIGGS